jgi:peptidyl-tRNA hydrolase
LAGYVLSPFNQEERAELPQFVERAVSILERLLKETISRVMSDVNSKNEEQKNDRKESQSL